MSKSFDELVQDGLGLALSGWNFSAIGDRWTSSHPPEVFYDIGAVVYYLRIISWQVADFTVEKYRDKLLTIHDLIQRDGKLVTLGHRILVEAHKE